MTKITLILFIIFSFFSCKKIEIIKKEPIIEVSYNFSEAEKILNDNLEKYKGNAVLMVSQNGKIVLNKTWGTFNENTPQPIASATKWLSGAVLMSLIDEGKLSLNDSIGKFLPIFTKYKKGNITIQQCFSHTSGFPSETPEGYEKDATISLAECVNLTAQNTKLIAKPGQSFIYGNVGMQIAGRIAEVVSGKTWQELFNQKIGIPCGMTANYSPLSPKNPRIAGGAVTSARAYLNFLEMIVNKGVFKGKKILSEQSVADMLKDQTNAAMIAYTPYPSNIYSETPTKPIRYGIGNWLDVMAGNQVTETSSPGLYGTHPWYDSKHKVAGILFTLSDFTLVHETNLKVREAVRKQLK